MGDNADLVNALQALATAIAGMQPPAVPTARAALLHPFQHGQPFGRSFRSIQNPLLRLNTFQLQYSVARGFLLF